MTVQKRIDPEIAKAQQELADWAKRAESYIEGNPEAKKVVVFLGSRTRETDISTTANSTKVDLGTVKVVVAKLRELGVMWSSSSTVFGLSRIGEPFIAARLARWKMGLEVAEARKEFERLIGDDLRTVLELCRKKILTQDLPKAERHQYIVQMKAIREILEKRRRIEQAG